MTVMVICVDMLCGITVTSSVQLGRVSIENSTQPLLSLNPTQSLGCKLQERAHLKKKEKSARSLIVPLNRHFGAEAEFNVLSELP